MCASNGIFFENRLIFDEAMKLRNLAAYVYIITLRPWRLFRQKSWFTLETEELIQPAYMA